jgi:hypothetical protein
MKKITYIQQAMIKLPGEESTGGGMTTGGGGTGTGGGTGSGDGDRT